MLNVDWFQPFKHCTDSLGAIYLVIMNLPRRERYKHENVILAGLIPSLHKEPASLKYIPVSFSKQTTRIMEGIYF